MKTYTEILKEAMSEIVLEAKKAVEKERGPFEKAERKVKAVALKTGRKITKAVNTTKAKAGEAATAAKAKVDSAVAKAKANPGKTAAIGAGAAAGLGAAGYALFKLKKAKCKKACSELPADKQSDCLKKC